MKTPTIYTVLISLTFFFLLGCSQVSQKKETPADSGNSTSSNAAENVDQGSPHPAGINADESDVASGDPMNEENTRTVVIDACGNSGFDLLANIRQSAESLSGTVYVYGKTDCSGMFHQVLDGFRGECPNAILPNPENARSSRHIAAWYDKNGDFTIVRNSKADGRLIKPGMVMFFGHTKRALKYNYQTMTIDTLKAQGIGINHVAIVTDVKLDANGRVQSYEMFHGLNKNKVAQITTSYRESDYPVYGNWGEPWLAVAEVLAIKD